MITRVPLHIREGLGSHKLHYTGEKLGPNTLQRGVHKILYTSKPTHDIIIQIAR